jgi:KUP system potassium uptake protein
MIATIVIVAAFQDLQNLSNAYGFAVATVMFSTSVLIAIQIPAIKHLPVALGIAYFLTFGFFDGMFLI